MSRYLDCKGDLPVEVIVNMNICKYCIDDMCCNDNSKNLGIYYKEDICNEKCDNYIKEDGEV